jgi:AraC-like DNA-binding protein
LDDAPLPFVRDPVHDRTPATAEIGRLLADLDDPLDELAAAEAVVTIADTLQLLSGPCPASGPVDSHAVELVREHLAACAAEQTPAAELERISGLDRFAIARQFRRAFGTSPDRYRTMRRLDLARAAIAKGLPIVRAAADAGFSDQSHLTRQFKRAFGITPAAWAHAVSNGRRLS